MRFDSGMLIAQITDLHVRRKGDLLLHMIHTGRELRASVRALNALVPRPAFVVATGDLVDRGKRKEYTRLRTILAELSVPVYLLAGNHDERDALRAAFPDHAYLPRKGPLSYVVETRPVRLVALDSTNHAQPYGEVNAERLAWLDARLAEAPAVPTLLAMHHPPFDLGIKPIDAHPLRGRAALAALVASHPQVVRIIGGHVHIASEAAFGGTLASTAPSTSHQLVLDRVATGGYTVRLERPAFTLHRWIGRGLVTTTVRTGDPAPALRAIS